MSNVSNDMSVCNIDPCHPPIMMFINDNNLFTPSVEAAVSVPVIKHVIFQKCKKRRDRDEDECDDIRPDIRCRRFRSDFR